MSYLIYRFTWQGIEIIARYDPSYFEGIAHLEIETIKPTRAPLPITETGYKSHFHPTGTIEGGHIVDAIIKWLDDEAQSKDWRDYIDKNRQLELF